MSDRYKGAILSPTAPTVIPQSAGGVYTLSQQLQYQGQGVWPSAVNYPITKSLRFRSSASAYLNRTPASATNRKTWTWSAWVKRGGLSSNQSLFAVNATGDYQEFRFTASNTLQLILDASANNYAVEVPTVVWRDVSAWYHIVLAVDTTQATSTNRVKIYVNGIQQTVSAVSGFSFPAQNFDTYVNATLPHAIGNFNYLNSLYFDGYMTEINLIDGQALTPSSFGTTDAYGIWQPIRYSGTYGTNGFYLPFTNTTSTSTLGNDFSGNSNTWTVNNISLTSGSTYDSMTDVPTNTNSNTANYCVLNPISSNASLTLTNANLSTPSNQDNKANNGTIGVSTGKWYWEVIVNNNSSICPYIGVTSRSQENDPDVSPTVSTAGRSLIRLANPYSYKNYTATSNVSGATNQGTTGTIGVALNLDIGEIKFYNNNTLFHTDTTIPTNGTVLFPYIGLTNSGLGGWNSTAFNFGQQPFSYTPPSGFYPLNTYNLPTPTILDGDQYFNAVTYTGTSGTQAVTGVGFQPDFVWIKARNSTLVHVLQDAVRGITAYLVSNATSAENTNTASNWFRSFDSNGFTVADLTSPGGVPSNEWNGTGYTYVSWNWKASNAAGVSNTQGTITSTVSANTTAGFSIVTYTGNGSNSTVGHGLGVAPSMVIVKQRNTAQSWCVWHTSIGSANVLFLNSTSASTSYSTLFNSMSTLNSTVFSIGTDIGTNQNTGTYVAYCFAAVSGYSAFGSYTGNGSNDGPFIFTGFRPRFVMFKGSSIASNWCMLDSARNTYNLTDATLQANSSAAELTNLSDVDFLSNGIKIRDVVTNDTNVSGQTYVYMAFAENPFKIANAR